MLKVEGGRAIATFKLLYRIYQKGLRQKRKGSVKIAAVSVNIRTG
jgi:hypothetical protein